MNTPVVADCLSHFNRIPRIDLLLLILMSIATLGIYTWWWMYSRSVMLNDELPPDKKIDQGFMRFCLAGFLVTLVLAFIAGMQPGNLAIDTTVNLLSLVLNIVVIVWVLRFRAGANYLLGETNTPYHMNVFWTLLFQIFYMQHKINLIRSHNQIGVM